MHATVDGPPDNLLDAARFYRERRGWAVHPLHGPAEGSERERGKKPKLAGYNKPDYQGLDTDAALVAAFGNGKGSNLGIVVRPPHVVVDLDSKKDAGESVRAWLVGRPELAEVPRERTAGGAHLHFICRDAPKLDGGKQVEQLNEFVTAEIFTGPSNMVISPSVHPSGQRYAWEVFREDFPEVRWQFLVETFKAPVQARSKGRGDVTTLDVEAFARDLGIYGRRIPGVDNLGRVRHTIQCPWHELHTLKGTARESGTVLFEPKDDGPPAFDCQHAHCQTKTISDVMRWAEEQKHGVIDAHCAKQQDRPAHTPPITTIDGKPALMLPCDDWTIGQFSDQLGRMLATTGVYERSGIPFTVNATTHQCEPVTADFLRTWAENTVACFTTRGHGRNEFKVCKTMSIDTARAVVASQQFSKHLKPLSHVAMVRTPVLRASGDIVLRPRGYDQESRVYTATDAIDFDEDMDFPRAKQVLDDLLKEFPFAEDGGRSRAVAISAMLAVYGNGLITAGATRPCFIYLGNMEGSGKTLLARIAALPYGNVPVTGGPSKDEEWDKLLLSIVIGGRRIVIFDNVRGHLASQHLERYLTSSSYSGRILGVSKEFEGEAGAIVCITGNRLTVSPDLRRRSLFVELFCHELSAERRRFTRILDEPALTKLRPDVLAALHALVRHWDSKGRPPGRNKHASFPRWAETIGGIMEAAGYANPCQLPVIDDMGDTDAADIQTLCSMMPVGKRFEFSELAELCVEHGLFERVTERRDGEDLDKAAKTALGRVLKGYHARTTVAGPPALHFLVQGKGHSRFFTMKPATGEHDRHDQHDGIANNENTQNPYKPQDHVHHADHAPDNTNNVKLSTQTPPAPIRYVYVTSRDVLAEIAQDLTKADKMLALDLETYGQDPLNPRKGEIRTLTVARRGGTPWIIDLKAIGYDLGPVKQELLKRPLIIHNARFDLGWLAEKLQIRPIGVDTLSLSRLLTAGTNDGNDLGAVLKRHLGVDAPKHLGRSDWGGMMLFEDQLEYASRDVAHLHDLGGKLASEIKAAGMMDVMSLEIHVLQVVRNMTATGFAVDVGRLGAINTRASAEASAAAKTLQGKLGPINMASPKQLIKALKGAGHGVESTDNEALQGIKDKELAAGIIAYRESEKLAQQAQSLLDATHNGRIHADYDPTGTATGRFSCKRPNLQNVSRGELRDCFIASPGKLLVVCDYSQVELRLAAYIAKDERMLTAFRDGIDLHAATAAIVLDKVPADVTKQDRQLAKAVNFGLIYGQSARGLVRYAKSSYGVELSEKRAHEIRDRFFGAYAGLARWHKVVTQDARGFVSAEARTLLGRRQQLLDGDWWPRFTRLVNTPVQGTAADGIKKALVRLAKALPVGAHVVATIHDEIVVECEEAQAPDVLAMTKTTMIEGMAEIAKDCPVEVEGGIGKTWGSAK